MKKNSVIISTAIILTAYLIYKSKGNKLNDVKVVDLKDKKEDNLNNNTDVKLEQQPDKTSGNPDKEIPFPKPNEPSNTFAKTAINTFSLGTVAGNVLNAGYNRMKRRMAPIIQEN